MKTIKPGAGLNRTIFQWLSYCLVAITLLTLSGQASAADKFKKFKLKNLSGETVRLEDYQDKATLVAFFFPTCGYCNKALPETVKVYEKYRDQGLSMVLINLVREEEELIPEWLAKHQFDAPVVVGASMQYLANRYDIEMTPEHLIIDSDRKILFRKRGYHEGDESELEAQVRTALNL